MRQTRPLRLSVRRSNAGSMRNEFTAVIEHDGDWYIGYCPEIPGANGQGRTVEECRRSLVEAIALILQVAARMACAAYRPMRSARRCRSNEAHQSVETFSKARLRSQARRAGPLLVDESQNGPDRSRAAPRRNTQQSGAPAGLPLRFIIRLQNAAEA